MEFQPKKKKSRIKEKKVSLFILYMDKIYVQYLRYCCLSSYFKILLRGYLI